MSRDPLMIEGVVEDPRDATIESLHDEVRELRAELEQVKGEARAVRQDATRALSVLRRQLSPLYRALQGVFGELDAAGANEASDPSPQVGLNRATAVWAMWKSKLGEGPAKIIDALLLHGDMSTQQLSIATGYHRTSIPAMTRRGYSREYPAYFMASIYKLNQAGLLNKNSGRFSLKQL